MKRILIVDDHSIIRAGLKILLASDFSAYQFDEAATEDECLQLLKINDYSLIILDINIPGSDTFKLVETALEINAENKILMFSMNAENIYAKRFLHIGVKGYIRKDEPTDEIVKAVREILGNKKYISKTLSETLSNERFDRVMNNPFEKLSPKQFVIAQSLIKGSTVSDICNEMQLHSSTVSTQKNRIFEKLNIKNLVDLYSLAKVHTLALT